MHQSLRLLPVRLSNWTDHDQQHCYHHVPMVNQGRLLQLMGMRMPETCWAVFKRQAINLRDWCIWLVDLFEYMMVHDLQTLNLHLSCLATISLLTYLWFIYSSSGMCSSLHLKKLKCLHFQGQIVHPEAEGTTILCYIRKYPTKWHHFPDFNLQQCCCEKLKPHISVKITT